jgi:selenocysteine lyase/cysteine desulfurase
MPAVEPNADLIEPAYDLVAVRAALPILADCTYLNPAGEGLMAEPVLRAHLDRVAARERGGQAAHAADRAALAASRGALAGLVGAEPRDITLNRNSSEGLAQVICAFPLRPGDEAITTHEEAGEVVSTLRFACDRAGATIRYVEATADPARFQERLDAALTPRTRLVALSHVGAETGLRTPVGAVREVIGPEVAYLIDAAQAVANVPVDVIASGADYVVGSVHKWLCGPKGTSFLWLNPEPVVRVDPLLGGWDTLDGGFVRRTHQGEPATPLRFVADAARFEYGTAPAHALGGIADAVAYLDALGASAIEAHQRTLTDLAKRALLDRPGVTLFTPLPWSESSGIVTFALAGRDMGAVSAWLRDETRIWQRPARLGVTADRPSWDDVPTAIRVSFAYFASPDDLDRLLAALDAYERKHPLAG